MASHHRVRLEPVQLEQLERLRVVARGDLDLVAAAAHDLDERPEDEDVSRCRDVDPDAHQSFSTTRNLTATTCVSGLTVRSKKRSCATRHAATVS